MIKQRSAQYKSIILSLNAQIDELTNSKVRQIFTLYKYNCAFKSLDFFPFWVTWVQRVVQVLFTIAKPDALQSFLQAY